MSLLARSSRALIVAGAEGTRVTRSTGSEAHGGDPLDVLRAVLREIPEGRWPDEGGVVGALAYDYARPGTPHAATPLLVALAVDRFEVHEGAADPPAAPHAPPDGARLDLPAHSSLTREQYTALVLRVKEHIAQGDIYQANLSQRFRAAWPRWTVSRSTPICAGSAPRRSPGYLRAGGVELVSASPERLLSVEAGRPRPVPSPARGRGSADARADRALAAELMLSEKERAEHLMLVDLARNDLGRVAAVGSVEVDELMVARGATRTCGTSSPTSTARLAPGCDALDALAPLFPGGTITGVPKVRCMQILDALRARAARLLHGRALLRDALGTPRRQHPHPLRGGGRRRVTFHAGGGIVADSDPLREYEETLHKAEAMRLALEAALREVAPSREHETSAPRHGGTEPA